MIKHIVTWKLKDFAEGADKRANARIMKQKLEALKNIIPEIKMLEVGIKGEKAPATNFDFILITGFADWESLETYRVHPDHRKIAEFIGKITEDRAAIDFES